jgi:hypothetical protein
VERSQRGPQLSQNCVVPIRTMIEIYDIDFVDVFPASVVFEFVIRKITKCCYMPLDRIVGYNIFEDMRIIAINDDDLVFRWEAPVAIILLSRAISVKNGSVFARVVASIVLRSSSASAVMPSSISPLSKWPEASATISSRRTRGSTSAISVWYSKTSSIFTTGPCSRSAGQ